MRQAWVEDVDEGNVLINEDCGYVRIYVRKGWMNESGDVSG